MKPKYYVLKARPIVDSVLIARCVNDIWSINCAANDSTNPTYEHNVGLTNGWLITNPKAPSPLWRPISNIIAETMWPNITK